MFLASCQTIDRSQRARLTSGQAKHFSSDTKGEGYGSLEVSNEGERKFTGEFEWLASHDNTFTVNILNPFGENMLRLEKRKNDSGIHLLNRSSHSLPLKVGKDGFLVFANNWVGLKPEEIPSFLGGKIPGDWLKNKKFFAVGDKGNQFYFEEQDRDIYLNYYKDKVCYNIRWNVFWWIRRTGLEICHYKGKEKKTTFLLDEKYEIKTKMID